MAKLTEAEKKAHEWALKEQAEKRAAKKKALERKKIKPLFSGAGSDYARKFGKLFNKHEDGGVVGGDLLKQMRDIQKQVPVDLPDVSNMDDMKKPKKEKKKKKSYKNIMKMLERSHK